MTPAAKRRQYRAAARPLRCRLLGHKANYYGGWIFGEWM